MAICSHGDYLLPHVEHMTCVALSTTGGKTRMGKPAPRYCERGEKREGMTLPIVDQVLRNLTKVHAGIQTLSRLPQLSTTSHHLDYLEGGSAMPCVPTAERKPGKHKPGPVTDLPYSSGELCHLRVPASSYFPP